MGIVVPLIFGTSWFKILLEYTKLGLFAMQEIVTGNLLDFKKVEAAQTGKMKNMNISFFTKQRQFT